jgi:hypothetical protein
LGDAFLLGGPGFQGADVRCATHGTGSIEEIQRIVAYVCAGVHCRTEGVYQIKILCIDSGDVGEAEIHIMRIFLPRVTENDVVMGIKRRINQWTPGGDPIPSLFRLSCTSFQIP